MPVRERAGPAVHDEEARLIAALRRLLGDQSFRQGIVEEVGVHAAGLTEQDKRGGRPAEFSRPLKRCPWSAAHGRHLPIDLGAIRGDKNGLA